MLPATSAIALAAVFPSISGATVIAANAMLAVPARSSNRPRVLITDLLRISSEPGYYLRSLARRIMTLPASSATALTAVPPSISGALGVPAGATPAKLKSKRKLPVNRIQSSDEE